ncbi:MAG: DUF3800 domain-containing protein [Thermomicrobiales bacterium]
MHVLYLDEAGDHSRNARDPTHSVFVLGGVIVERNYARTVMEPAVRALKREWFGSEEIILHTSDIARARNGFEHLREDVTFRTSFLAALSQLMQQLDYVAIACVILKDRYVGSVDDEGADLYDIGLSRVVERFCDVLGGESDSGIIVAERRRPDLDHLLELAWERRWRDGDFQAGRLTGDQIDAQITGLSLKAKSLNIAGLQLADLVISPVARHFMGLRTHGNWDIIWAKVCRDELGQAEGYGLVVLPDLKHKK